MNNICFIKTGCKNILTHLKNQTYKQKIKLINKNMEQEIEELKNLVSDYEDIVKEKDEQIEELKDTIKDVRELLKEIYRII